MHNLETLSGANSIHHTYGICYQNIHENQMVETTLDPIKTRKRKIKDISRVNKIQVDEALQPYMKKPRLKNFVLEKLRYLLQIHMQ